MKKERAKECIGEILKDSKNKGTYHYIQNKSNNLTPIYQSIHSILENCKVNSALAFEDFKNRFHEFNNTYKKNPGRAVNNFLSFLNEKSPATRLSEIPQKIPEGKKITRKLDLKHYGFLYEYFTNKDILFFHPLMALKSFRLENYYNEDESTSYIINYFGITNEKYLKDKEELQRRSERLNKMVVTTIQRFKESLKFATNELFTNKNIPQAKMWFVDVFKEDSWRYLKNWKQYQRKSTNKPDFKKAFRNFKKFIKGATSKELGYDKNYRRLRYVVIPQGLIYFLHDIDRLLYELIDYEKRLLTEKAEQIKDILKDVPQEKAYKLLSTLRRNYPQSVELSGLLNIEKDLSF